MEPEEPPLPVEAEVGRLVGGRLDPSEALRRKLLDPWRGGSTRQLRRELRILSAQVGALTAEVVELHVQAQDGDVGRDDTREQRRDDPDPKDTARDAVLALDGTRSRSRDGDCLFGPGCGGPGHY